VAKSEVTVGQLEIERLKLMLAIDARSAAYLTDEPKTSSVNLL
jgi:hypothetical protein